MFDIYMSKLAISPQLAASAMQARRAQSKALQQSGFHAEAEKNLGGKSFQRFEGKPGFLWSSIKSRFGKTPKLSEARARRLGLAPRIGAGPVESAKINARTSFVPAATQAKRYAKNLPLAAGIALAGYGISRGLAAGSRQDYNTTEEHQNR